MNRELVMVVLLSFPGLASRCCGSAPELRESISGLEVYCSTSRFSTIGSVEEWGFSSHDYSAMPFVAAIAAVSNHWQDAIADWDYYATNNTARLLLGNLVGFAGTNALIGMCNALMDIREATSERCRLPWLRACASPTATPLEQYLFMNYDLPAVSNCLHRMCLLYTNDIQMTRHFEYVLSGEYRMDIEEQLELERAALTNGPTQR